MFIALRKRLDRGEKGFTLIELMVVVLIIAILIAIAIPTFLGARKKAQDKQAQSNVRNALTAEKTFYVDNQAYAATVNTAPNNELTSLQGIESNLAWVASGGTPDASQRQVMVVQPAAAGAASPAVVLQANSKSGQNFCLADVASATGGFVQADVGTWYANTASGTNCPAAATGMAGYLQDSTAGWKY